MIQGTLVTSNAVQVVWLPGPNSIPSNNGPPDNPTHKSPTDPISDPINTFTGNFYTSANDTAVPAPGVPFRLERWYNSLDPSVGPLGRGWTSDLFSRLSFDDAGDAILHDGEGSELAFQLQAGAFVAPPGSLVSLATTSGGYALLMHDASVQRFDAQGRLVSWLDPSGNGLSLSYSGDLLTQVQDSGGHSIGFSYDAAGHLIGVALPNSTTLAYAYDGDLLTSVTDPAGKVTRYGYDAAGHLTTITDPNGATLITNRYDDQGRIVEQDDALGNTATFDWGSGVQTVTATDATGATWTDTYQNGELVQRVDPLGGTTSFTYDSSFDLTSTTDPRGLTTDNDVRQPRQPDRPHLRRRQQRELDVRRRKPGHEPYRRRRQRDGVRLRREREPRQDDGRRRRDDDVHRRSGDGATTVDDRSARADDELRLRRCGKPRRD